MRGDAEMAARDVITEFMEAVESASDWSDARCRDESGATTGLFFSDRISDIAAAKAMCTECSYQRLCLDGAVERGEVGGVWGGQLFADGRILTNKRGRGRPPKNPQPTTQQPEISLRSA